MNYEERDAYGNYVDGGHKGPGPGLMGAHTLVGDHVHNLKNEHLGTIKEIMLDMRTGQVAYAVMASGGVGLSRAGSVLARVRPPCARRRHPRTGRSPCQASRTRCGR